MPYRPEVDHDRFVAKNKMLANAYDTDRRGRRSGKKGDSDTERDKKASCFNCRKRKKCPDFRGKRSGGAAGAASFGGDERLICDKYESAPTENKNMSDKQIKSLLKNMKKNIR
ncbi:MAG: hypothetical protein GF350_13825 [Chitinivibrionales bacterium]|nr:hypothetical protein [Chitinivibrionales bacterium]